MIHYIHSNPDDRNAFLRSVRFWLTCLGAEEELSAPELKACEMAMKMDLPAYDIACQIDADRERGKLP